MNLKDITYGLIILIIPLILILVLHRFYVYNTCHNNKECIKKKVLLDIDTVNYKLINNINFLKKDNKENEIESEETDVPQEEIEGFFGGISDWVYGKVGGINAAQNVESPVNNLNPSANTLKAANSTENSMPDLNSKFPNENINDSSNQDLLDSITKKKDTIKKFTQEKINPNGGLDKLKNMNKVLEKNISTNTVSNFSPEVITDKKSKVIPKNTKSTGGKVMPSSGLESKNQEVNKPDQKILDKTVKAPTMSMFKDCNFYSDKCPSDYNDYGSIGLSGLDKNVMLSCGNVENTKPAKAIAKIKNNAIEEVIVLDKGHGFNPDKPPKVTVVGGKGNGAHCEAIIDDDGFLSLIKVIHPGNFYTETPNIMIEAPLMNSNCHFCCKLN